MNAIYPGDDTLAAYVQDISDDEVTDAACKRGIGAVINGERTRLRSNVQAFVRESDSTVWLRAIRDIRAGAELLSHTQVGYASDPGMRSQVTRYVSPSKRNAQRRRSSASSRRSRRSSSSASARRRRRSSKVRRRRTNRGKLSSRSGQREWPSSPAAIGQCLRQRKLQRQ